MEELYSRLSEWEKQIYRRQKEQKATGERKTPLISPLNDMIDFNPFQYRAYVKLMKQERGKTRKVYIADEVGSGKTFQVGIIITELLYRKEINPREDRCIIICPNMICRKWRDTLRKFFGIDAAIVHSLLNPGIGFNIISYDTLSRASENDMEQFNGKKTAVKLLVADEAHNASGDRHDKMKHIRECVSEDGYVVLLSATPLSGAKGEEHKQIQLLMNEEKCGEAVTFFREESSFLSQNKKKDMRYATGGDSKYVTYPENHYVANTELCKFLALPLFEGRNTLLKFQGMNMLLSSPVAGMNYFGGLLAKSDEELLYYLQTSQPEESEDDESEDDDWEEDAYERVEYTIADVLPIRNVLKEINDRLKEMLGNPEETDEKLKRLIGIIEENRRKFEQETEGAEYFSHVIVFTDRVSTAKYLEECLSWRYKVFRVTGELFESEKQQKLMQYRNETREMSILIITNVACEGQDMDYGNTLINYDLDYNPVRLEQRRGRVDRFKAKHDVYIHNFMVKGFDLDIANKNVPYNGYSKVRRIQDKIEEIYRTTGSFYEIFERNPEAQAHKGSPEKVEAAYAEIAERTEITGEAAEKLRRHIHYVLGKAEKAKETSDDRKQISDSLRTMPLKRLLKKTHKLLQDTLLESYGEFDTKYDLISKKMEEKGIRIEARVNERGEEELCIVTSKANQEFLRYVYNGGTLISHLRNE